MSDLENVHQSHRHLSTPVAFTSVERACMLCIYDTMYQTFSYLLGLWEDICIVCLIFFSSLGLVVGGQCSTGWWCSGSCWGCCSAGWQNWGCCHSGCCCCCSDCWQCWQQCCKRKKSNPADKMIKTLGGHSHLQSFDGWPKNGDSHGEESHLREGDRAWICCGGTLLPSWKKRFK